MSIYTRRSRFAILAACRRARKSLPTKLKGLWPSWIGRLPSRRATSHVGSGSRAVDEYLLSQEQVNYLITRCGLPAVASPCPYAATPGQRLRRSLGRPEVGPVR